MNPIININSQGPKLELEEEEEDGKWTDYENLFSLVILLTYLQRPWWRQSRVRVGRQSNFHYRPLESVQNENHFV